MGKKSSPRNKVGLYWTGEPYVDVGIATVLAFCEKDDPTMLTEEDFDRVACWIIEHYTKDPLKSFLTVAYTNNSWFAQASFNKQEHKRIERGQRHLYAWQKPALPDQRCVFTGRPAAKVRLSDKLPIGRAARAQIPLVQGDDAINFYPNGDPGLPISGPALLCLQAFPLGCAKVAGRLLAVHASEPAITLEFAREFLAINRRNLSLAQEAGESKMPETRYGIGTLLIDTLMRIHGEAPHLAESNSKSNSPFTITAYHLTNSGQSPEVAIYHLPLGITTFLRLANTPRYKTVWQAIVARAWTRQPEQSGAQGDADERAAKVEQRNYLYEDLLQLPNQASRFLRVYFLRRPLRLALVRPEEDPRAAYSIRREFELISWDLTALFLREVMNMDKTRIDHIRNLGDRLAHYIEAENDQKFLLEIYTAKSYELLRNALIKAGRRAITRSGQPLVTFDQFVSIFEEGEELPYRDWKLARDLLLIHVIERLAPRFRDHTLEIPDEITEEEGVA
jgi:CRISPR-associated protein Cst1